MEESDQNPVCDDMEPFPENVVDENDAASKFAYIEKVSKTHWLNNRIKGLVEEACVHHVCAIAFLLVFFLFYSG